MTQELLQEIKEYIEKSEANAMWEYSSDIVDDKILYADRKRMPDLYFKILDLLTPPVQE